MVAAGADVVLAFPLPGSRGTWSCVRLALKAGLEVRFLMLAGAGVKLLTDSAPKIAHMLGF